MPVENAVYDRMADSWWDEAGFLHALAALNPARFGYMRRVVVDELQLDPVRLHVLDIGCGGGLLAKEFALIVLFSGTPEAVARVEQESRALEQELDFSISFKPTAAPATDQRARPRTSASARSTSASSSQVSVRTGSPTRDRSVAVR